MLAFSLCTKKKISWHWNCRCILYVANKRQDKFSWHLKPICQHLKNANKNYFFCSAITPNAIKYAMHNFYIIISVMYNNNLCRTKHDNCKMSNQHFLFILFKTMTVLPLWPYTAVYCERRTLVCPEGPICSSCRHKGELPGWKLPLDEGYLAGSTHLLVTVLRYACPATLCGTETIIVSWG